MALFLGANVAPDERRANDVPAFIEKDRAVHLPGEANTGDVFASEVRARKRFAHGDTGGAPPILGLLLGPANLRGGKRLVILRGRRDKATGLIDYDRARAAGADVDSENVNGHPPRTSRKTCADHDIYPVSVGKGVCDGGPEGSPFEEVVCAGSQQLCHFVGH